jgi:hypothetical protein
MFYLAIYIRYRVDRNEGKKRRNRKEMEGKERMKR